MKTLRSLLVVWFFTVAPALWAADIQVFAAASLTDALKEIGGTYGAASGDRPVFNFGASSTLARQIEEGAPADLFISADEAKMDALAAKALIDKGTRVSLLGNTLAIVVAAESTLPIASAADLAGAAVKKIALAETQTVPAGIYAREYLTQLKLWDTLSPRVVPCDNVRATLAAVEAGNCEAGIVYKTDAAISKKVRVALEIPAAQGPKITYPFAVTQSAKEPDAAKKFLQYLASEPARAVFARFGFVPLH